MYTEERRRGNLLKDFILKLILIIIFVLLLIWLVPWPNMDSLNPLKDQIFNANLQTMKEAGITYYTTERLPQEVGDKDTLTLQKMLDMKLLIPFTDRNGNSCDVTKSYVSLEKQETEYLMKVNLKCGSEENYILVHLGCYSYCTADLCEKQNNGDKQVVKPTSTPKPTSKPIVKPTSNPTPKPTVTPVNNNKECEYKKDFEAQYSVWSSWAEAMKKSGQDIVFGKTDTKETVDLGIRRIVVGTQTAIYENVYVEHTEQIKYKTLTYKLCNNYNYVGDINTTYRVLTDWVYTDEYISGYRADIPADTLSVRWVLQGVDYNECKNTCVSNPYMIYRKQTRKIEVEKDYSNVTATCTDITDKSVDVYISVPVGSYKTVLKEPEKTLYGNVQFYQVRTRTLLRDAYTDYQWVDCKNESLVSQGYTFTGKTRTK